MKYFTTFIYSKARRTWKLHWKETIQQNQVVTHLSDTCRMVWHCQILSNIIECMFPKLWAWRFTYIKPMFLCWSHQFILAVHLWYYLTCQSRGSYEITLLVNCNKQQLMTLNLQYSNIGQFCFYSVFRFNFTNAENKNLHCFDFK